MTHGCGVPQTGPWFPADSSDREARWFGLSLSAAGGALLAASVNLASPPCWRSGPCWDIYWFIRR